MPQVRLRLPRPRTRSARLKMSTAALAVAVAGVVGVSGCSLPKNGPTGAQLLGLRMCESGGNYAIATGNGYYGAYQFDAGTWASLGFGGLPNQAAPLIQDMAVIKLWEQRGWAPWPGCAASLGLR